VCVCVCVRVHWKRLRSAFNGSTTLTLKPAAQRKGQIASKHVGTALQNFFCRLERWNYRLTSLVLQHAPLDSENDLIEGFDQ